MLKPLRMSRRTWGAAWAVLCAAAIAATAALNASPAPDPQPEKSVSVECAAYIADIETQLGIHDILQQPDRLTNIPLDLHALPERPGLRLHVLQRQVRPSVEQGADNRHC
ncbi:hypothetical protein [Streptomyces sp. NPDC057052]|uniref:hypothetical protein n=1 Tax=Streptomyces sp. NPDC057052 TaxID=3346010 RepID=UPI00362B440D